MKPGSIFSRLCTKILGHIQDADAVQALLRLLLRFTRNHKQAQLFAENNGLHHVMHLKEVGVLRVSLVAPVLSSSGSLSITTMIHSNETNFVSLIDLDTLGSGERQIKVLNFPQFSRYIRHSALALLSNT